MLYKNLNEEVGTRCDSVFGDVKVSMMEDCERVVGRKRRRVSRKFKARGNLYCQLSMLTEDKVVKSIDAVHHLPQAAYQNPNFIRDIMLSNFLPANLRNARPARNILPIRCTLWFVFMEIFGRDLKLTLLVIAPCKQSTTRSSSVSTSGHRLEATSFKTPYTALGSKIPEEVDVYEF